MEADFTNPFQPPPKAKGKKRTGGKPSGSRNPLHPATAIPSEFMHATADESQNEARGTDLPHPIPLFAFQSATPARAEDSTRRSHFASAASVADTVAAPACVPAPILFTAPFSAASAASTAFSIGAPPPCKASAKKKPKSSVKLKECEAVPGSLAAEHPSVPYSPAPAHQNVTNRPATSSTNHTVPPLLPSACGTPTTLPAAFCPPPLPHVPPSPAVKVAEVPRVDPYAAPILGHTAFSAPAPFAIGAAPSFASKVRKPPKAKANRSRPGSDSMSAIPPSPPPIGHVLNPAEAFTAPKPTTSDGAPAPAVDVAPCLRPPENDAQRLAAKEAAILVAAVEALAETAKSMFDSKDFAGAAHKYGEALERHAAIPAASASKFTRQAAHSNRAAALMMMSLFEDAVDECRAAVACEPLYAPAYLRCARALLYLGELEAAQEAVLEALTASRTAQATHSKAEEAQIMLERINAQQAAEARAAELLSSRAFAATQAALAAASSLEAPKEWSWNAVVLNCQALIGLGRPADVERVLLDCLPTFLSGNCTLRTAPTTSSPRPLPEALLTAAKLRAEALWHCGDVKTAVARLIEIVRLPPQRSDARASAELLHAQLSSIEARGAKANELFRMQRFEAAAAEYAALVQAVRECACLSRLYAATMASNRAAALMSTRDYAGAVLACTSALELHPPHAKARLRRARAHVALDDLAAATADFRAVEAMLRTTAGQRDAGLGARVDVSADEVAAELAAAVAADKRRKRERARRELEERERLEREERESKARARQQQQQQQQSGRRGAGADDTDDDEDDFAARFGGASWFEDRGRGRGSGRGGGGGRAAARPAPPPRPPQPPDHYGVLGLTVAATPAEVRRAYRAVSLKVHPDKHGGCAIAAERFKAVAAAHEVLSDPAARLTHDAAVRAFIARWPGAWVAAQEGQVPT